MFSEYGLPIYKKKSFICVSKILFLNCMCVHVCLLTHTCIGIVPIKVSVLTKARVKGNCETPSLDAGTQTWVLRNSSANFSLMHHLQPRRKK